MRDEGRTGSVARTALASLVPRPYSLVYESMKQTIAVVDDEETIRETVAFALRRDGYDVITFADGGAAWDVVKDKLPSLAILDITMPRMDGLELCRRLRARSETLPIIFLTSRDEELDRVLGLELGADDYLCKPFSMRELAARVKVLFRRLSFIENPSAQNTEAPLRCGPQRRLSILRRRILDERQPPEEHLHARRELAHRERLAEIVVCAELESENAVELFIARREKDDRKRFAARAQTAAKLETVHARHGDVEDRERRQL